MLLFFQFTKENGCQNIYFLFYYFILYIYIFIFNSQDSQLKLWGVGAATGPSPVEVQSGVTRHNVPGLAG